MIPNAALDALLSSWNKSEKKMQEAQKKVLIF